MKKLWVPVKNRFQSELIKRGHCVGCGRSLVDADRQPFGDDQQKELVVCQCRRAFVYDKQLNHYRRASKEEFEQVQEE